MSANLTTITFDGYANGAAITGADWTPAPAGVGTAGTSEVSPPVVGSDSLGAYLGSDTTMLAQGGILPTGQITQVSVLADVTGTVRVVLPLCHISAGVEQFVTVEVVLDAAFAIKLHIYLSDPFSGLSAALVGSATIANTDETPTGILTVESGPKYIRAWFDKGRSSISRRAPDAAAYVPWILHESWGIMTSGGKIRAVHLDTTPTAGLDTGCSLSVDTATPDLNLAEWQDPSSVALAVYTVVPHTKSVRTQVVLSQVPSGGDAAVAETIFHRLDAAQTLIAAPVGDPQDLRVTSLAEGRSGPSQGAATYRVDEDPRGTSGGIGSGRTSLEAGGELYLDPGVMLKASTISLLQDDVTTQTGGPEARQQVASRQRRSWDLQTISKPAGLRLMERVVAAAGGARGVWFSPPLDLWPVPVIIPEVSYTQTASKQNQVQLTPTEI